MPYFKTGIKNRIQRPRISKCVEILFFFFFESKCIKEAWPQTKELNELFARVAEELRCLPDFCLPCGAISHSATLLIRDLGSPPTVSWTACHGLQVKAQTGTTHFLAGLFTKQMVG